jgi:hypothetical protein
MQVVLFSGQPLCYRFESCPDYKKFRILEYERQRLHQDKVLQDLNGQMERQRHGGLLRREEQSVPREIAKRLEEEVKLFTSIRV